jgi:hypothetical protein
MDHVQAVAERFCELLDRYDPKRGRLDRYAFLCLGNALHALKRGIAAESRRAALTVSLDESKEKWEGRDD